MSIIFDEVFGKGAEHMGSFPKSNSNSRVELHCTLHASTYDFTEARVLIDLFIKIERSSLRHKGCS